MLILRIGLIGLDRCFFCLVMTGSPQFPSGLKKSQHSMVKKDQRINDYINKAQEFAKPILEHLRAVIHKACPDVKETIKWGCPHFEYEGKILCSMASFKEHCAFGFRLGTVMKDPHGLMQQVGEKSGMGHFGQIRSMQDLPSKKILTEYIREAMALNEQGVTKPKQKARTKEELVVPEYFYKVLKKNREAYKIFEEFSYSNRKDYVEWITEAKTEETRNKRMATAVEWIAEGKGRNWKYMKLK